MKTKKIIKYFTMILSLSLLSLMNCNNYESKWGLNNFHSLIEVEQKKVAKQYDLEFSPTLSSNKFIISLFFPNIEFKRFKSFEIKDSILQSLNGMEVKIYEKGNDSLIIERKIDYLKDGHRKNIFREREILDLPILVNIKLDEQKKYRFELIIPPRIHSDLTKNIIIGIGTSATIFP